METIKKKKVRYDVVLNFNVFGLGCVWFVNELQLCDVMLALFF